VLEKFFSFNYGALFCYYYYKILSSFNKVKIMLEDIKVIITKFVLDLCIVVIITLRKNFKPFGP